MLIKFKRTMKFRKIQRDLFLDFPKEQWTIFLKNRRKNLSRGYDYKNSINSTVKTNVNF